MYDKPMLGLGQAQDAIAAILAEANKEPDRTQMWSDRSAVCWVRTVARRACSTFVWMQSNVTVVPACR